MISGKASSDDIPVRDYARIWLPGLLIVFFWSYHAGYSQANHQLKGVVWEDDRYDTLPIKINYDKLVPEFPSSYSLKQFCPRVVNQGGTNTAASWAAIWYARTILDGVQCKRKGEQLNTQEAYNNFFNNRIVQNDCSRAVSLFDLLNTLVTTGARKYNGFETFCVDSIPPAMLDEAREGRVSGYVRMFNTFDSEKIKVNTIKSAISNGNPVVIGMVAPLSFANAGEFWLAKEEPDKGTGGHAVCVIGYDDARQAIEVVNSWGRSWGRDGYTWIRYDELRNFVRYGFELFNSQYGPCTTRSASATVKFFLSDGTEMKVQSLHPGEFKLEKSWPTRTNFKVLLRTEQKGYVYGIFADPTNAIAPFFPWPGQRYANAVTTSPCTLELPLGNLPFTLTPPAGNNYLAFLFSSTPIDLPAALKKVRDASGDFQQKLKTAFRTRTYGQNLQWQTEPRFIVDYDKEMFVMMVVRLDQE